MTREEAIDRLRKISEKTPIRTNGDDLVAITMAIQSLSQEPIKYWIDYNGHVIPIQQPCDTENCKIVKALIGDPCKVKEPCDDAVSRDAVIDALSEYVSLEEYEDKNHTFTVKPLIKRIVKLPPVTQKSGKWIKGYTFPDGAYWKCNKCNELIKVKIPMRYCNNCGAKMESEE
jgi:hypothetical protein